MFHTEMERQTARADQQTTSIATYATHRYVLYHFIGYTVVDADITHTWPPSPTEQARTTNSPSPPRFRCSHDGCKKAYTRLYSLERHLEKKQHVCQPSCAGCPIASEVLENKRKRVQERRQRDEQLQQQHKSWGEAIARELQEVRRKAGRSHKVCDPKRMLRKQAKVALRTLFGGDYVHSLAQLLRDDEATLKALGEQLCDLQPRDRPSIEELLAFKDEMQIPTNKWHSVVATFGLGRHGNISQVRELQDKLNTTLPIKPTGALD
jgi:hypothetical protein